MRHLVTALPGRPIFAALPNGGGGGNGSVAPPVGKPYIIWKGKIITADTLSDWLKEATPEMLQERASMALYGLEQMALNAIPPNLSWLRTLVMITTVGLDMALGPYLKSIISDYKAFRDQAMNEIVAPRLAALASVRSRPWPLKERIVDTQTDIIEAKVVTGARENRMVPVNFVVPFDTPVTVEWNMWAHDVFAGIGNIGCTVAIWGREGNAAKKLFEQEVWGGSYFPWDGGKSSSGRTTLNLKSGEYLLIASAGYTSSASIKVTVRSPIVAGAAKFPIVWVLAGGAALAVGAYLMKRQRL